MPISKPDGTIAQLVTTASSNGTIHVYDISTLSATHSDDQDPQSIEPIYQHDTKGSRLTCLTVTGYTPGRAPTDIAKLNPADEASSDSESSDSEISDSDDDDEDLEELDLEDIEGLSSTEATSEEDGEEEAALQSAEEEEEEEEDEWGGIAA